MSIVARRIRATPERSAVEVWRLVENLISQAGSDARGELEGAAGVAASLIADEAPKESPIVIAGCGPRLRIYCVYGEDAVTGEDSNEADLAWDPTAGDWSMWLPASGEDIEWVRAELAKRSKRIMAYNLEEEEPGTYTETENARSAVSVNLEAFRRL